MARDRPPSASSTSTSRRCEPITFRDLFGHAASGYAAFRPRYPEALFSALAAKAPARRRAWDCATGSGQAAVGLSAVFAQVIATDASRAQLAAAVRHPRIQYVRATAESSGLAAHSIDLATVAQALHWIDRDRFFAEARRVLRPGGVLAAWCYGLVEVTPAIDALVRRCYTMTLGPYWPPERALVDTGYRTLEFPFAEFALPPLVIEQELTLDAFAGYLRTWSATQRCIAATGTDPVGPLVAALDPVWGGAERRRVRWPLAIRAGYALAA